MIRHDDDDDDDDDGDGDSALVGGNSVRQTDGRTGGEGQTDGPNLASSARVSAGNWSRATAARDGYNPENNGPRGCTRQRTRPGSDMTLECGSIHNWRSTVVVN